MDDSSNTSSSKALPIAALIVSLVALAAAVAAFFIEPSDKTSTGTNTTVVQNQTNNAASSSEPSVTSNVVETNNTAQPDAAAITFDACGIIQKYAQDSATYPWFATLNQKYMAETGVQLYSNFGGAAAEEGCYSANGDMFIFITPNGYSQASTIYKYEINNESLAKATLQGEDAQQFHASSEGFGTREGDVIHLEPALTGDAGSCAEFMYDYNFVTNTQIYLSQKSVACN